MKAVRFSQVVAKAGRPEVYLLFNADDPEFKKVLRAHRVMTVVEQRAATSYGTVGYDATQHGQLLLFPKSLEVFADMRVVGIKFDLLAESPTESPSKQEIREKKKRPIPAKEQVQRAMSKKPSVPASKPEKSAKVIAFPRPEEEDDNPRVEEIKQLARKALAALTKRRLREAERALTELLKS